MTPAMMLNLLVLVMAIVAITLASIAYANRNPTVTCSCPAPAAMSGASASANGVSGLVTQPLAGDEAKYLAGNAMWTTLPAASSAMVGATTLVDGTSGLVPQPLAGDEGKSLKGDGTWQAVELGFIGMADVASPGGIFAVPDNIATAIPMNTLYETGYAPHPSFTSNTTTGTFDILIGGRYRVNAQMRMEDGKGQVDYELSVFFATDQVYVLSTSQTSAASLITDGTILSGSVILDLAVGDSVTCLMTQVSGGALNAFGPIAGFVPPAKTFFSYMQIERLQ